MNNPADRLIGAAELPEEVVIDRAIRPQMLADYIGQTAVKRQMNIFISAARQRSEALVHTLIFGPPGLGKTTLAHIIAKELNVNLRHTSGPVLERPGDLAAILTSLEPNDVLFVDEIHRLSPVVEEVLYAKPSRPGQVLLQHPRIPAQIAGQIVHGQRIRPVHNRRTRVLLVPDALMAALWPGLRERHLVHHTLGRNPDQESSRYLGPVGRARKHSGKPDRCQDE